MSEAENTGTAAAVNPAQAEAPEGTAGGGVPAQLTPYQKRKARQEQREREAAEKKAAREAKKAGKAPTSSSDEKQRARETGGFWRLTLRIVGLLMWPFGWRLEQLTAAECAEDVALLAPLASRHRWLEVLIRYAALPYLLVERMATKAKKREPAKTPPKDAA